MIPIEESMEMIQTEKKTLLINAKKIGEIWKRGTKIYNWKKFFCVLSGGYLYFYEKAKEKNYDSYFYVKKSQIKKITENIEMKNAFQVF